MRDLTGKLDRLEQMVEAGQITRRFALERAAAMGEWFEGRQQHRRCEALLARWLRTAGIADDLARSLREKMRTSRPSDRTWAGAPAPLFDLSDCADAEVPDIGPMHDEPAQTRGSPDPEHPGCYGCGHLPENHPNEYGCERWWRRD